MRLFKIFTLSLACLLTYQPISNADTSGRTAINQLMADTAAPLITNNQIPGVAIAIYYNGQDYYFNYGVANKRTQVAVTQDTIFELASITKIFVTTLLALEIQDHKISLSDPIVNYLPALAKTGGLPVDKVQVVNLATHTASFPRQMEQFGVGRGNITGLYNRFKSWQPFAPIGTQYKYSNVGFGLLGAVIEGAAHNSLTALLSQNITNPLGMNHTYFTVPQSLSSNEAQGYRPNNNPAPKYVAANFLGGGALRSSAADLLKFMKANLGVKVGQASPQLLSAMQLAQQPNFVVKPQFVMALGWQRVRHGQGLLITKNGGNQGYATFIGFSPSNQLGVVVLTNQAKGKATLLGNKILRALLNL